jgi:hypothetical protein
MTVQSRDGARPRTLIPFGASVTAWMGAILSSLCCLLPLAVIVLGLGSGAFMAVNVVGCSTEMSAGLTPLMTPSKRGERPQA